MPTSSERKSRVRFVQKLMVICSDKLDHETHRDVGMKWLFMILPQKSAVLVLFQI